MTSYTLRWLTTADDMLPYYNLVLQLGYSFTPEQYRGYLEQMIPKGYHQLVVLHEDKAVGMSGYWINIKLFSGPYVELDNVVVDEAYRNAGIGKILCEAIEKKAAEQGCTVAVLDAYVENFKAHRFYYRQGYIARGYHFLKKLP
ncbi:MAG TPA: GNAT family N-acetyltransferase [Flavisolibacter sp.]|jgi:ribosomal protein S18 acetylase RimI-like enzyme|nr:GNAT family N-acetyltransferase [Flavisolibacter sp.]